jgi:hypothetical protein
MKKLMAQTEDTRMKINETASLHQIEKMAICSKKTMHSDNQNQALYSE